MYQQNPPSRNTQGASDASAIIIPGLSKRSLRWTAGDAVMRGFEIYVRNKKVTCDIPSIHVPPHTHEDFAVYLKSGLETKYKLGNLRLSNNPRGALTQQRLNDSTIILHDDNNRPGTPKFNVTLTPIGTNPKVTMLDPRVVNE